MSRRRFGNAWQYTLDWAAFARHQREDEERARVCAAELYEARLAERTDELAGRREEQERADAEELRRRRGNGAVFWRGQR